MNDNVLSPRGLSDKQLEKLSPQQRAAYIAQREHQKRWGHLPPQVQRALQGVMELAENAVENHAKAQGTDPVHFAAARAFHRWPIGQEMSSEEYVAAIEQTLQHRHGY